MSYCPHGAECITVDKWKVVVVVVVGTADENDMIYLLNCNWVATRWQ